MRQPGTSPVVTWSRAFPADPAQIHEARGFLAGLLGDRTAAADAVLCLSELATNAILHSRSAGPGGWFTVQAELAGERLRVEVGDQGGPWTRLIHRDGLRGRGLLILAELAASWGRAGDASTGWRVWFEMSCPARPAGQKSTTMPQAQRPDGRAARPAASSGDGRPDRAARPWIIDLDGSRLRQLRRAQGLSQAELAGQAGVGLATLTRLERQPRGTCRGRTLTRLASALGEHPAVLKAAH